LVKPLSSLLVRGGDLEEFSNLEGDEDEIEGDIGEDIGEDEVVRLPSSRRSYGGFYAPLALFICPNRNIESISELQSKTNPSHCKFTTT